ncbi:unnamed protein product [Vicia faba]|uniref:Uncharacterized protein n=1 Tax=Vicia faba TaxID=3906 RepID=A0AAV1AA20_VICFA|nr:unnamed protein product [Vicia faba]
MVSFEASKLEEDAGEELRSVLCFFLGEFLSEILSVLNNCIPPSIRNQHRRQPLRHLNFVNEEALMLIIVDAKLSCSAVLMQLNEDACRSRCSNSCRLKRFKNREESDEEYAEEFFRESSRELGERPFERSNRKLKS